MEENNNQQPTYRMYTNSSTNKKQPGLFKNVFVPFCASALGTFLVIGVCFGTPRIKSRILNNTTYTNTGLTITEGSVTNKVGLTDYSNTSISVANKVLPSIVGITVEYRVNSMFGGNSLSEASGSGIIVSSDGYI